MKDKFASVYSGPIKISEAQSTMKATTEKPATKKIKLKKLAAPETHRKRRNKIQGKEGDTFMCPESKEKVANTGNPA